MNRRQEITLFVIVAALVVTWLFPPWDMHGKETMNLGYSFLFTQAQRSTGWFFFTIDWGRLLLGYLMIAAVGGWLLYALRSKS